MKGRRNAGATADPDNRRYLNSSRSYFSRDTREEAGTEEGSGRISERSFTSLAQMRRAFDRSNKDGKWSSIAIIVGTILLAGSILSTLGLALNINSRANKLVQNDATRAIAGAEIIDRIESKIDNIYRKVTNLTTTTVRPRTTTTVTRTSTTGTTRTTLPPLPPLPPMPTTTIMSPPPTTIPPCRLSLLGLCILP